LESKYERKKEEDKDKEADGREVVRNERKKEKISGFFAQREWQRRIEIRRTEREERAKKME